MYLFYKCQNKHEKALFFRLAEWNLFSVTQGVLVVWVIEKVTLLLEASLSFWRFFRKMMEEWHFAKRTGAAIPGESGVNMKGVVSMTLPKT